MFGQNFVHILVHSEQSLGKLRSKLRSKLHSKLRSKLHLKLRSKLHSNLGWPGLSKLVLSKFIQSELALCTFVLS